VWEFTPLTESDVDSVVRVEAQAFRRPWGRAAFLAELVQPDAQSYALRRRSSGAPAQLIGYVCFRAYLDEMHLLKIAVEAQWRRSGVASWMLARSLQLAARKGARSAYLEVRPSNRAAIALYRKHDFQIIGKRPNYYPETGEDALVFMKTLKEEV
jgi:ribosomal-protein-alanine N-acetyltransferase